MKEFNLHLRQPQRGSAAHLLQHEHQPSVFDDEGVNLHTRHHGDTGFLTLLAQPQIKLLHNTVTALAGSARR